MSRATTPFRAVRSVAVDFNPSAQCQECDWGQPASPSTTAVAKAHAEQTGHEVLVERVHRSVYMGVAR